MQSILVVTDLSPQSELALKRAAFLAAQHGARIEILHQVNHRLIEDSLRLFPGPRERMIEQILALEDTELREQLAALNLPASVEYRLHLEEGGDFAGIIQRARAIDADLIVIGVQGKPVPWDPWPKGMAEKIIRKGDRNVLVTKKWRRQAWERIMLPIDFSAPSRQAVHLALHLAPDAYFHFLHIFPVWGLSRLSLAGASKGEIEVYVHSLQEENEVRMVEFLADFDLQGKRVKRSLFPGHPAMETLKAAHAWRPDLIAMGTQGRTGLPYVLLGSVAEEVIRRARCDVLAVRSERGELRLP